MTDKILSAYTQICVLLFFTSAVITPSGYTYGSTLLLLAALPHLLLKRTYSYIEEETIWMILALLIYAASGYLEVFIFNLDLKLLEKPSFFIGAAITLLYLKKHPPKQSIIWLSLALGGIATGFFALWFKFVVGLTRIGVYNNPIQYGNISLLIGLLSFCGIAWGWQQKRNYLWVTLLLLGFVFGLTASLLSGSRGGWIALPAALAYIVLNYRDTLGYKTISLLFTGAFIFILFCYSIESTGVKHRTNQAFSDLRLYKQGYTHTSLGVRLELWKDLSRMFKDKPVTGWGKEGYYLKLEEMVKQKSTLLKQVYHPHSDILHAISHRGIIGLLALAILYSFSIISFRKAHKNNIISKPISIAGIILIFCYIDFGLTDMFINKRNGILYFLFPLIILLSSNKQNERSDLTHAKQTSN